MAVYPSVYRARVTQIRGRRIQALVPQVFGEAPIVIEQFIGAVPTRPRMGWVFFQGGSPEFPVFATGGSLNISVTEGGGGEEVDIVRQRNYQWSTNTAESDPGHGKGKANADPESATELYFSLYDSSGQAAITALELKAGDEIVFYEVTDISKSVRYTLTADLINNDNEWLTLPVTVTEYNGFAPKNNASIVAAWFTSVGGGGGGGGTDEVWIGPTAPSSGTIELWVDTDALIAPTWDGGYSFLYTFNDGDSPPATGELRLTDTGTHSAATVVHLHNTTADGIAFGSTPAAYTMCFGNLLVVSEVADPSHFVAYRMLYDLYGMGAYSQVDVVRHTSVGANFVAGSLLRVELVPGRIATLVDVWTKTGTTYTPVLADINRLLVFTNASNIAFTVPTAASVPYQQGSRIDITQTGSGRVTVAGDTGVTVTSTPTATLRATGSVASLIKLGSASQNTWLLTGDLG